jgi:xanthine dehydrogenase accessory factor
VVTPYEDWSKQVSLNVNTFVVVATRGHRYDDMALESALNTRARYIGLMGSRRKSLMIYQRLLQQGVTLERLREVKSPIGLDIGALTPEEIAVSVMSEIIMTRRGGSGGALKMDDWFLERSAQKVARMVNA